MKTALICMLQLHKNSGSARTAYENIRYFKSRGYEVHVAAMTMDKEPLLLEGAIPHKILPWISSTGFTRRRWYNWQVKLLRKKLNPTITVGHGDIEEQDVLTLHNSVFLASELIHGKPLDPKHEMSLTHGPLLQKQTFKRMIANSKLMKEDSIKRFQVDPKKIQVVYPALDTTTFYPVSQAEKDKLRIRFGFSNKLVVALVTSGNFKKRGLDILVEAIKLLPQDLVDKTDFRVVGKDEQGQYKNSPLTFDPGLDDIQNYYRAIDIFVLPARIEEFGRVVLEAMGCGVPVITTDKVGAGELLEGKSRHFVIPSHRPESLKEALVELLNSSELRQEISKLNAETALKEAESKLYEKFDSVFLDILHK